MRLWDQGRAAIRFADSYCCNVLTSAVRGGIRRAVVATGTLSALVLVAGCSHPAPPTEPPTTHNAAWVDAAISMVGTQSGHDPVIEVTLDPSGAEVVTRQADTRVQRVWFVPRTASAPQARTTLSPTPTMTPSASATSTDSASAARSSESAHSASTTPEASASTPMPSATPLKKVDVDNTAGNMSLGTFGDTKVAPMWQVLTKLGCTDSGWQIKAIGAWNGAVITYGTCNGKSVTQVNGSPLPDASAETGLLQKELGMIGSISPNKIARLTILRSPGATCPIRLVADYTVPLGGSLNLRTTLTCATVTTQTLSAGYLPPNVLAVTNVSADAVTSVVEQLTDRKHPISSLELDVFQPVGSKQIVIRPKAGKPSFSLQGNELK